MEYSAAILVEQTAPEYVKMIALEDVKAGVKILAKDNVKIYVRMDVVNLVRVLVKSVVR